MLIRCKKAPSDYCFHIVEKSIQLIKMNFITISRTNLVLLLAINLIAADETEGEGFKIVFQTLKVCKLK